LQKKQLLIDPDPTNAIGLFCKGYQGRELRQRLLAAFGQQQVAVVNLVVLMVLY
jgi:hypothetical protein